jgi:dihydrofolate reductase
MTEKEQKNRNYSFYQRFVKPSKNYSNSKLFDVALICLMEMPMRKVMMFNMVSLDGFFEGPNQEIDWHVVDEEFNQYAIDQFSTMDTILFGRITYLLMASFWPSSTAAVEDPITAKMMNDTTKIVFSRTLEKVEWQNTTLVNGDAADEIEKLKQLPGRDMMIFGSGRLVSSLAPLGLIDEYRLMVNPVVLGSGNPLFVGLKERLHVKLMDTKSFKSGNVLLTYQPDKGEIK